MGKTKYDEIHGGEIVAINDGGTRGHGSLIKKPTKVDRLNETVFHVPITHSPITRNQNNILLQVNPEIGKDEDSYILPKMQKSKSDKLGKKKQNLKITNQIDKSVIRHIKKMHKKRR